MVTRTQWRERGREREREGEGGIGVRPGWLRGLSGEGERERGGEGGSSLDGYEDSVERDREIGDGGSSLNGYEDSGERRGEGGGVKYGWLRGLSGEREKCGGEGGGGIKPGWLRGLNGERGGGGQVWMVTRTQWRERSGGGGGGNQAWMVTRTQWRGGGGQVWMVTRTPWREGERAQYLGYDHPVYDPAVWEAVPEEFRDCTLENLVHNRVKLEHFKQFLC